MRISDSVLPAPRTGTLPEPIPLRRMLGPSVILLGLSIGSGEFILWPRLTAEWGFALFWACWVGVTLQFFINMEITRWTLATGESAVLGFVRLHRAYAPIFLLCATAPWIWPGWATGAAVIIEWQFGWPVMPVAITSLIACGVVLSIGPVVYQTVERIQFVLVVMIVVLVVALTLAVVEGSHVRDLVHGGMRLGQVPEGVHLPMLLGALAFAGAGGSVNLAQSNYIKDKGYGMGARIGRITSPFTGNEEARNEVGVVFEPNAENLARWRVWWRRSNIEHGLSFYALALLMLASFCLLAAALVEPGAVVPEGFGFIRAEALAIEARFGAVAEASFLFVGVAALVSTELALLDAVARVAADLLNTFERFRKTSLSKLYFAVVWSLIAFGVVALLSGFDQPLPLIVLSAALNGVVMFLYSGLLLWMNMRSFDPPLRPTPVRIIAMSLAFLFFGYFSVLTLIDRFGFAG